MGSSCKGDALILCRLLGFAINSIERPLQLGAVCPVVYALNEFFLAISWKMTEALLPVSGPVSLLEVDVGSMPGRR